MWVTASYARPTLWLSVRDQEAHVASKKISSLNGNGTHRRFGAGVRNAPQYSAFKLLKHGLTRSDWPRVWRHHEMKSSYDVVIIGGGVHGLATAYYLAKNHGITNVAVVDKAYLGGGGSGRNTAILRSNYLTPEGVRSARRAARRARVRASSGCRVRLAAMITPTCAEPVAPAVALMWSTSSRTISIAGVMPPTKGA